MYYPAAIEPFLTNESTSVCTALESGLGHMGFAGAKRTLSPNRALGRSYRKNFAIAFGALCSKNILKGLQNFSPKCRRPPVQER